MSKEVAEEYASSLADLTVNSKPLINMLTILAEENIDHAGVIVESVEKHLEKVHPDIKLPVLYLVDSIVKNVGDAYAQKFSQSIVNMFRRTFKQVDEKVRLQMFNLRQTWHGVFTATKLYQLDVKVNLIDPAWPIQAQPQPVNKATDCIAPVSGALFPARRDPRLVRHQPPTTAHAAAPVPPVAVVPPTDRETAPAYVDNLPDPKRISKLPNLTTKINRSVEKRDSNVPNPNKRKRENAREERRKRREKETPKESERPTAKECPAQASSLDKNFNMTTNKNSISNIMSQAKEHLNDGQLDENQNNTLMYQVLQLNERLKLYEAKQRELLEISKRKLNNAIHDAHHKVMGPKYSPSERNNLGDIDERVTPSVFMKSPPGSQGLQHSDMRLVPNCDRVDGPRHGLLPLPPPMPIYGPYPPMWRGQQRPRDDFGSRRYRGQMPPYFRGKFDKRAPRPPFVESPRMPIPSLPTPKITLNKAEPAKEESSDDVTSVEKMEEEAIEIKDVDETIDDQSDNESLVEVVEDKNVSEPVEIVEEDDEVDEDDVVLIEDPVEEVIVDDDNDTDDETTATRTERDRQAEIDFSKIKIKQEPMDPDDEPIITAEESMISASADTTHATMESSIDGNLQLDAVQSLANTLPVGGIRINISKSLPTFVSTNQEQDKNLLEDVCADDEPLPPGEEPKLEYKLKPSLEGVQFKRQPPVCKGNELSGLCSIM